MIKNANTPRYSADGGWPALPAQPCEFCGGRTDETFHDTETDRQGYGHKACVLGKSVLDENQPRDRK